MTSDLLKRPLWPWFAVPAVLTFAAMTWMIYLYSFVDEKWNAFAMLAILLFLSAAVAAAITASCEVTYTKRPRGWRKLRRQAEERAYIEQLEKELGYE